METRSRRVLRILLFSVWSVVMTALTYVLGAAPLKVVRIRAGRPVYWLLGVLISGAFFFSQNTLMGLAFFSLVVLVGLFDEMEEAGFSFMVCGFFTLLINTLLSAGAFALWVSRTGPKWSAQITGVLEAMLKPLADLNPHLQINTHDVMVQLPSVIIILWMSALYLAVLLENRLMGGEASLPAGRVSLRSQLAEVRVPDPVVWVFILSILGAFGGFPVKGLETASVNLMNICLLLFFFQGIAVVVKTFANFKVGAVWQFMFMVLIVLHLFLFVALLGLTDYWMDFRLRLVKRTEGIDRRV